VLSAQTGATQPSIYPVAPFGLPSAPGARNRSIPRQNPHGTLEDFLALELPACNSVTAVAASLACDAGKFSGPALPPRYVNGLMWNVACDTRGVGPEWKWPLSQSRYSSEVIL
jgi:hypothetical protein